MNWIDKIRAILGPFWSRVFKGRELVSAVYSALNLSFTLLENTYKNWRDSRRSVGGMASPSALPELLKVPEDSVFKEGVPLNEITSGTAAVGDYAESGAYVLKVGKSCENAGLLTRTAVDTKPLRYGVDFEVQGDRIYLKEAPADYALPCCQIIPPGVDEAPHTEYRIFCWNRDYYLLRENVNDILGLPLSGEAAEAAWATHVQGATVYNVKWLLCAVTGCVLAKNAGLLGKITKEGGTTKVLVGDVVYEDAKGRDCNYSAGTRIRKGDILFGGLRVFYSDDKPDSESLPSLQVMTDAGVLVAENKEISIRDTQFHDPVSGVNCLPLAGDEERVRKYILRCRELARSTNAPVIQIPDTVNPALFVLNTLRSRRSLCIVVPESDGDGAEIAIKAIMRNAPAGAIISLIKETSASASLSLPVTADTSLAVAISAEASIAKEVDTEAESEELI